MVRKIILACFIFTCTGVFGETKRSVFQDVPVITQGEKLCGPATLEMLFRFWGERNHSQYDIARSMLAQFPNSKRYTRSGILNTNPIEWSKYPGTGTINMREFLKRFGRVKNIMLENDPLAETEAKRMLDIVKKNVSRGFPVIVHQYWGKLGSRGHYRIVTGYDESRQLVFLNDASGGRKIQQTYTEFLKKWNFDQQWLHYNAIIFYPHNIPLDIQL